MITAFTAGQLKFAALHRISTGSKRSLSISRSTIFDLHFGQRRERNHRFFVFAFAAEANQRCLVQPAGPAKAEHDPLRRAVIARADARADLFGDLGEHVADRRPHFAASPMRAGDHARPRSPARARRETSAAECRAAMPTFSARMPSSSARLTRLEEAFCEMRAPRFSATLRATSRSPRRTSTSVTASPSARRSEMARRCSCPLVLGDIDQVGFGEPRRELQHRLGDGDVVVVGERAQDIDRRVGQRSKTAARVRRAPCSRSRRSAARRRRRTDRHAHRRSGRRRRERAR